MDLKQVLNNLQDQCNLFYGEYGAYDNVIQLQVAINSLRCEFNIPDESELISGDFVQ